MSLPHFKFTQPLNLPMKKIQCMAVGSTTKKYDPKEYGISLILVPPGLEPEHSKMFVLTTEDAEFIRDAIDGIIKTQKAFTNQSN